MEEKDKDIDQSWKERADQEKEALKKQDKFVPPEPNFTFFITTLSLQASIFLGEMNNPVTDQKEEDLAQAKLIIDTMDMLKGKTAGNLNAEEDSMLENVIYELKMIYISKTKELNHD
jgi:hypothetical protein